MADRTVSQMHPPKMRGYFGVGCYGISKAGNAGAIFRTAHAFGSSFVFTINAAYSDKATGATDTSKTVEHIPFYQFPDVSDMLLPKDCKLVGIELTDDAVELPSFRHPLNCAYILGPERGSIPDDILDKCDFTIKIPTQFCLNVSVAAALVLYDRVTSMGRFAPRAVRSGKPSETLAAHIRGDVKLRSENQRFLAKPPTEING